MAAPGNLPAPNKLNVYQASAQYRRQLLAREQATVDDFVRRYIIARHQITRELDALVRRIEAAEARGQRPVVLPYGGQFAPDEYSASWLYRVGRLDRLAATIEGEIGQYTQDSLAHIQKRASTEAITGGQDAGQLLRFRVRDDGLVVPRQFAELPEGALLQIVAFSGPGGPHPKAFRDMGPELVRQVQQRLVDGLAKGENPRVIAAKMQADTQQGGILDRPLYEQMRVARTEPLRAYRESSRATYGANADVVESWEWRAFPGPRTCPYCLAMDGSIHSLDEVMATHPQCRCTSLPRTAYSPAPAFTGAEYLYNLSPDEQDQVFGSRTMGELYRRGKFQLGDMVEQYQHPDWGQVGRAASMRSLEARGIITRQDILEAKTGATSRPLWAFASPTLPNLVPIVPVRTPTTQPAPEPQPAPKPARSRPIQTRTKPAPKPEPTPEQDAVAWQPTMTAAQARKWNKGTAITDVQFHVMAANDVQTVAGKGFDTGIMRLARVWGEGVYMTDNPQVVDFYKRCKAGSAPQTLQLAVKVDKVLVVRPLRDEHWRAVYMTLEAIPADIRAANGLTQNWLEDEAEKVQLRRRELSKEVVAKNFTREQRDAAFMAEFGQTSEVMMVNSTEWYVLTRKLRSLGYDAIKVVDPSRATVSGGIGGDQLIIFNPNNVTVIKESLP